MWSSVTSNNCKKIRLSTSEYHVNNMSDSKPSKNSSEGPKLPARKSRGNNSLLCHNHTNSGNNVLSQFRVRNPFKLVPCKKYGSQVEAPFTLSLSVEALAIIDVHSHCVRTEVIGLLGGLFCSKYRQLNVLTAEPCESLTASTTDRQCEMDPVSQAAASERLIRANYSVCGWYHSHPEFINNPSFRDLETQAKYQQLFAETNQPFIAFIINPYDPDSSNSSSICKSALASRYKCLMLSNQITMSGDVKTPYAFTPLLVRKEKLLYNLTWRIKDLCSRIRGKPSTFCLTDKLRGQDIQYLDKISSSLRHHFYATGLSKIETERLLDVITEVLSCHLEL